MRALAVVATTLFLAVPAFAGGFSTTGLSSLPDGTGAGEPWVVDVTVLAHGRTPATGLKPEVVITRGDERRTFAATPVREGVYRAEVVFPSAGRWEYAVEHGYGPAVTYGAVTIGERDGATANVASSPASGGPTPSGGNDLSRWLIALAAGLAAAAITALSARGLRRRARREPLATG
jgi:hypothetical protein